MFVENPIGACNKLRRSGMLTVTQASEMPLPRSLQRVLDDSYKDGAPTEL